MNNYLQHQNLIAKILPILQNEFPKLRMFPRHVGLFYNVRGEPIQINKKGMYDYWALYPMAKGALHIEMEFKTGNAKRSKNQIIWGDFLNSMNCHNFVINETNVNDVIQKIKNLVAIND